MALGRHVRNVSHAAEDLDRLVRDESGRLARRQLRHGRLLKGKALILLSRPVSCVFTDLGEDPALVLQGRRTPREQSSTLQLQRHVRDLVLHGSLHRQVGLLNLDWAVPSR